MTSHFYRVYGLCIESQFPFSELPGADPASSPDVSIKLGEVPAELPAPRVTGYKFEAIPDQILLKTYSMANILISGGREICVQPHPGARENDLRLLLTGWAMGALLLQRGILPLHASSVFTGRETLALCAVQGTGKSSLAAAFLRRGCQLMDDDLTVITLRGEEPWVSPGCSELKLWEPAISSWTDHPPIAWQVRPGQAKYALNARPFLHTRPERLDRIFILERSGEHSLQSLQLNGQEKLRTLIKHIYSYRFVKAMGSQAVLFPTLLALSKSIPVVKLYLPVDYSQFDDLAMWISIHELKNSSQEH